MTPNIPLKRLRSSLKTTISMFWARLYSLQTSTLLNTSGNTSNGSLTRPKGV